jgi:hypothetical protein
MSKLIVLLGLAGMIILLVLIGPFLTIWAVNTLFPVLAIPYTFWTWCSVLILGAFFKAQVTIKK